MRSIADDRGGDPVGRGPMGPLAKGLRDRHRCTRNEGSSLVKALPRPRSAERSVRRSVLGSCAGGQEDRRPGNSRRAHFGEVRTVCSGPSSQECVAVDIESACLVFPCRTGKRVDGFANLHVDEPGVFEHLLPARTGQPAGDSAGPKVDVAQRLGWDRPTVRDVGELQRASGT